MNKFQTVNNDYHMPKAEMNDPVWRSSFYWLCEALEQCKIQCLPPPLGMLVAYAEGCRECMRSAASGGPADV